MDFKALVENTLEEDYEFELLRESILNELSLKDFSWDQGELPNLLKKSANWVISAGKTGLQMVKDQAASSIPRGLAYDEMMGGASVAGKAAVATAGATGVAAAVGGTGFAGSLGAITVAGTILTGPALVLALVGLIGGGAILGLGVKAVVDRLFTKTSEAKKIGKVVLRLRKDAKISKELEELQKNEVNINNPSPEDRKRVTKIMKLMNKKLTSKEVSVFNDYLKAA